MERIIMHIDVNNAFLSWTALYLLEQGYQTDIRNIEAIIAGDPEKRSGIVLAKSTPAKRKGVKTAETIYEAKRKCPNLKIFKPTYEMYKRKSEELFNILKSYTPDIEKASIDEGYLDYGKIKNIYGNELEFAKKLQNQIKEELGFTVNIGVANNKLLAKMASDFTKPDRIHTLWRNEISKKMWPLPVSELFMLGRKTVPKLYNMQIKTIGDLAKADKKILRNKFGKHGILMWEYANGIDNSEVKYLPEKPKGIGNSVTLPQNVANIEKLEEIVLAITEQVAYRLRKENLLATTVGVQLRNKNFVDRSHQGKLLEATDTTKEIYIKAKLLLKEMYTYNEEIRLVGVRVDNLVDKEDKQMSLFTKESNEKQKKLDKVMDELKDKYGYNSITRAGKMEVKDIVRLKEGK